MGWNEQVIKTLNRKEFIDMHGHLGDKAYLGTEYDKIVPPASVKTASKEVKKMGESEQEG